MHVLLHPINFSMLLKLIYNKASETVVIDMPQICFFSSQNMYFINKNFFNLSDHSVETWLITIDLVSKTHILC